MPKVKSYIKFCDDTNVKYSRTLTPIIENEDEYYTSAKKRTALDDFVINSVNANQDNILVNLIEKSKYGNTLCYCFQILRFYILIECDDIQVEDDEHAKNCNEGNENLHGNIASQKNTLYEKLG